VEVRAMNMIAAMQARSDTVRGVRPRALGRVEAAAAVGGAAIAHRAEACRPGWP
jgi:hypothetical protein